MSSVIQYGFPASIPWSEKLVAKLSTREYRHAYMIQGVKTWIARQVRALREQRGWSQEDLGRETGKPQSAISRVEDPDYGKLTLQTLFDLARAYDLPLLVQFVEWSDWLCRMDDSSTEVLQRESFSTDALRNFGSSQILIEPQYLEAAASSQHRSAVYLHTNWDTAMPAGVTTGLLAPAGITIMPPGATSTTVIAQGSVGPLYGHAYDLSQNQSLNDEDEEFDDQRLIFGAIHRESELAETDNG